MSSTQTKSRLSFTTSLTVLAIMAAPAHAQDAAPTGAEADNASSQEDADAIVVTGVRGSLARALGQKRKAIGIVDGISAEDIIDYPDQNIADSLQRITGVTVERSLGDAQRISVRGLASEFTRTTINGQTVTSGNAGREVNFDIFASELFNNVQVVKSFTAEQVEGGLAGTVDLRTARPFDYTKEDLVVALAGRATYNDLAEKVNPRLSGLVSTTLADGAIGVLASVSYAQQDLRQDNVEGLRFIRTNIDTDRNGTADTIGVEYPFIPRYVNENIGRERWGLTGAVQLRPSDSLLISIDAAYAKIDETRLRYSIDGLIEARDIFAPLAPPTIDATGLIVAASIPGVESRSENIQTPQSDELLLLNGEVRWDAGEDVTIAAKFGWSDASRSVEEFRSVWSSTGNFRYDFSDRIFVGIAGVGRDILDATSYNNHQARFINSFVDDEEFSAQADLEWRANSALTAVKVGARYSDATKSASQFDGRANAVADFENFAIPLPVDNFFEGSDAATIIRSWPVSDFDAVRASTQLVPANLAIPQVFVATNSVSEETIAGYFQADVDTEGFWGVAVRGQFGARIVNTKQASTGFPTSTNQITVANEYTEVLPSAVFTIDLTDNLLLRAGIAKSLTRPTISDLTPGGTIAVGVNTARFGNPELAPYTAWNHDASLEWYFAREALLSVAVFDKEIDGFVTRITAREVLGADVLGANDPRAGQQFDVSRPVNGQSAFVRGVEIGFQAPFSAFLGDDSLLRDFGILANYTYADSESEIQFAGETFSTLIRGQSQSSFNVIGYFERGPVSTRFAYAWRDFYLDEIRAGGNERSNFIDDYGQLDFNFQLSVTDSVVLTLDALNLLGEEQYRYAQTTDRNIRFSEFGRIFMLGARAKF